MGFTLIFLVPSLGCAVCSHLPGHSLTQHNWPLPQWKWTDKVRLGRSSSVVLAIGTRAVNQYEQPACGASEERGIHVWQRIKKRQNIFHPYSDKDSLLLGQSCSVNQIIQPNRVKPGDTNDRCWDTGSPPAGGALSFILTSHPRARPDDASFHSEYLESKTGV